MNDLLDKFVEDGFCELGNVIDDLGCDSLLQKVNATREFSSNLFLDKEVFHKNPQYRNKNPKMGGYNLAEKFLMRLVLLLCMRQLIRRCTIQPWQFSISF